eukprot:CAMPEP_0168314086 /NCGR_PEP_ID=MMETSP0210-20121227/6245_1 /TAXON_ID=40633 /ORGANISM="Condylostoma magnum, Strain COL2" /LENGTH=54 /DNA_ID=CAMNT_0008278603 /DNA_START=3551 /DNA_END=3715 /DNA_ORIENTATION=-
MAAISDYSQQAGDLSRSILDFEQSGALKLWKESEFIRRSVERSNIIIAENAEDT